MSIPQNTPDREFYKFVESPTRPNETAIETVNGGTFSTPSNSKCYVYTLGVDGIYYTESWAFYESGTPAAPVNLLKTISIYYTDAARKIEIGGVIS